MIEGIKIKICVKSALIFQVRHLLNARKLNTMKCECYETVAHSGKEMNHEKMHCENIDGK